MAMALTAIVSYLLMGGFLSFVVVGQTLVDSFRGEIRSCETACEKSYSGADQEQVKLFSFCRNGCRLLNVIDVLDDFNNLNDTKAACFKCCQDSYSDGRNIGACQFGCESQVQSAEQRRQQIQDYCYSQLIDSLSPALYITSIFSNMIERSNDRVSRMYYSQTLNGGLVVVAASSSIVSDSGEETFEGNSFNYMKMNGVIFGSVVDLPSLSNDLSSVDENKPAEINLMRKSGHILDASILKTSVSRVLAACLLILFVLFVIWIWTSAPAAIAKQNHQLLLEKQNLKYLQYVDDKEELQVFVAPSSDDIKAGPPQYAVDASRLKPLELIDISTPFPLKFKVGEV